MGCIVSQAEDSKGTTTGPEGYKLSLIEVSNLFKLRNWKQAESRFVTFPAS